MSKLSDRITAVIDEHWPLAGGNRCDCGWSTFEHEGGHARHVAEAVEAAIPFDLRVEKSVITADAAPYELQRLVSPWVVVACADNQPQGDSDAG